MAVKKLLAATILASISGIANAGMITDWGYINEAGFIDGEWTTSKSNDSGVTGSGDPVGAYPDLLGTDAFTTLTWGGGFKNGVPNIINGGIDNLQSSLVIDSPISHIENGSFIETNGAAAAGTDITHNNWIVDVSKGTLSSALLLDALLLMPQTLNGAAFDFSSTAPDTSFIPAPLLNFGILFKETLNNVEYDLHSGKAYDNTVDTDADCGNGTANGVGVNENGCADIFVMVTPEDVIPVITEEGNIEFTVHFNFHNIEELNDYDYHLTTTLSGLELITSGACDIAGAGANCAGFLTKEERSNVLQASFRISATAAEPSMIALMGFALLGMGAMSRRRKNLNK